MHSVKEQNQLIEESEIVFAVLGRAGEFILVDLHGPIEDAVCEGQEKGYGYLGVLGVVNGIPGARIAAGYDALYTCLMASLAFARLVADRLRVPPPTGDAVEWLSNLFKIPDTRPEA